MTALDSYKQVRRRNLLVAGNTLVPSCVGIFNLPPLQTCTPSRWCRKHCYALYGRYRWKTVAAANAWRYKQSMRADFTTRMIEEIQRRYSIKFIRIHLSGDFYNRCYTQKWVQIAQALPEYIFRANTKRVDLMRYMYQHFPENIVVRESTDPTRNSHGFFPQAAVEGTPGWESFFWCQDDCETCGFSCYYDNKSNIAFRQIR